MTESVPLQLCPVVSELGFRENCMVPFSVRVPNVLESIEELMFL